MNSQNTIEDLFRELEGEGATNKDLATRVLISSARYNRQDIRDLLLKKAFISREVLESLMKIEKKICVSGEEFDLENITIIPHKVLIDFIKQAIPSYVVEVDESNQMRRLHKLQIQNSGTVYELINQNGEISFKKYKKDNKEESRTTNIKIGSEDERLATLLFKRILGDERITEYIENGFVSKDETWNRNILTYGKISERIKFIVKNDEDGQEFEINDRNNYSCSYKAIENPKAYQLLSSKIDEEQIPECIKKAKKEDISFSVLGLEEILIIIDAGEQTYEFRCRIIPTDESTILTAPNQIEMRSNQGIFINLTNEINRRFIEDIFNSDEERIKEIEEAINDFERNIHPEDPDWRHKMDIEDYDEFPNDNAQW